MNEYSKYIDRKNALRYMGCRGEVSSDFIDKVAECEAELEEAMTPRYIYKVAPVSKLDAVLSGKDVYRHLEGCSSAAILAVTLGGAVDTLVRKYQSCDVARALIVDAEASAAVEIVAGEAEREIARATGKNLTWRYSPGYGDYPLECQSALLSFLDAERKIGLFALESFLLTPAKSVTAVIGLTEDEIAHERSSCESCNMKDVCSFKKEGNHCGF